MGLGKKQPVSNFIVSDCEFRCQKPCLGFGVLSSFFWAQQVTEFSLLPNNDLQSGAEKVWAVQKMVESLVGGWILVWLLL